MNVRARRRTRRSLLVRLRVFWIFIVVALAGAAYAGYALATWRGFDPSSVVVDGNRRVSTEQILRQAAIPTDRNVWLIDKSAAQRRVEALGWIKTAQIHRSLPAAVTIVVRERVPAACVVDGAERYLVDEGARVVEAGCGAAPGLVEFRWASLPALRPGATLDPAPFTRQLGDVRALERAGLQVAWLGADRFGGMKAGLRGGPLVLFGDDRDLAEKAKLVEPILGSYAGHRGDVAAIDLRTPATPVVRQRKKPHV